MPSPRSVLDLPGQPEQLTAVVVGAGIAGLLSAHVACRYFDRVVLVEGDQLTTADSGSVLEASQGAKGVCGRGVAFLPADSCACHSRLPPVCRSLNHSALAADP